MRSSVFFDDFGTKPRALLGHNCLIFCEHDKDKGVEGCKVLLVCFIAGDGDFVID